MGKIKILTRGLTIKEATVKASPVIATVSIPLSKTKPEAKLEARYKETEAIIKCRKIFFIEFNFKYQVSGIRCQVFENQKSYYGDYRKNSKQVIDYNLTFGRKHILGLIQRGNCYLGRSFTA